MREQPHHSLTFVILSICATTEKAAEIEGDLIEQSHVYGRGWMRRHVLLVALVLWLRTISRNWAAISLLCLATFAAIFVSVLLSGSIFSGPVGTYLLHEIELSQVGARLVVLGMTVFPAAYLIGAVLVQAAPTLGARAAPAAALGFTLFMALMHLYVYPAMISTSLLKITLEVALVAVPLMWGSIGSHRRALARAS
jgi:hypothetical protein